MEAITLQAEKREIVGKRTKHLRSKGLVPGVIYGHGMESRNVEVDYRMFEKVLNKAGESSLVDLAVNGGEPLKVIIQDVRYDPLQGRIIHVDFREVTMSEKLDAEVKFRLVGEAPAVKELGGILVRSMDGITIRCLPKHLVHEIDIDLSILKKFDDSVKVKDLTPPEGVEFMANPNEVIVVINEPISEEELKELEAKPEGDVSAVKVATEEKKAERAAAAAEETNKKENNKKE